MIKDDCSYDVLLQSSTQFAFQPIGLHAHFVWFVICLYLFVSKLTRETAA